MTGERINFLTFNRIPLVRKKRKILVPTGTRGSAAGAGRPVRPTTSPPPEPVQVPAYDCKALTSSAVHS